MNDNMALTVLVKRPNKKADCKTIGSLLYLKIEKTYADNNRLLI